MALSILHEAAPSPLRQPVVEILRNAFTECAFESGGRLIERELCEMLGVSRPTLRVRLREAGPPHTLEPNKGPTVSNSAKTKPRESMPYGASLMASRARNAPSARRVSACLPSARPCSREPCNRQGWFPDATVRRDGILRRCRQFGAQAYLGAPARAGNVTLIRGLDVNRAVRVRGTMEGARAILAAITLGRPCGSQVCRGATHRKGRCRCTRRSTSQSSCA